MFSLLILGAMMVDWPEPLGAHYSLEIDRHWRSVLMAFFIKRTHDRFEAEDLTQETLTRGLRNRHNEIATVSAYLFKIAVNLLRDRARRTRTRKLDAHDSFSDPDFSSEYLPAEGFTPERVLIGKEDLHHILDALMELDERTRDIFVLFRLEKMKQREIAARYGISVSAVEKQIVKAVLHVSSRLRARA